MALLLRIELGTLLIGSAVIVLYQMAIGAINTRGLFQDKGGRSGFSPARLQLVVSTLTVVFYYIGLVLLNTPQTGEFPRLPKEMLIALGGSHTFYLGSKTVALIRERLAHSVNRR